MHDTQDPISGATDGTLYQTERYGDFSYQVPVTAGTFSIEFHFAELYWEESARRSFNLSVENQTQLANFDLFDQAGHDRAHRFIVNDVNVSDGTLDITVQAAIDAGTLAGFAIYSANGELDTSVPPPPTCRGYVGITYDDGPVNTPAFVNALKSAGLTPVTFFVNGANFGNNSSAIQQMLTVGEVQNHSFDHVDMGNYSYQQVADQLSRNSQAIENAGAPRPTIFRPPYGRVNSTITQAASDLGMLTLTWDVDSEDWNGASASQIVSANGRLQNGQVILMHENQNQSLQAIPQIAANLKARGLCPGKLDPNTGRAVAP